MSSSAKDKVIGGEEGLELLSADEDQHGAVHVNIEDPMDPLLFASLLEASLSHWRQKGKKSVWIKLPLQHSNLVDSAVKAGFRYHHAEPDYLMLVYWIPNTPDNLPANASHRVGIGAFVMNTKRELLVVQETRGRFKGTGVWKMPTGAVNEGEDICAAAIREVKEETGIETAFVEILAFRQSHKSFFQKSDLFFVCMLQPHSFDIQCQASEILAAQAANILLRWFSFLFSGCQLKIMQPNLLFEKMSSLTLLPKYAYQSWMATALVFLTYSLVHLLAKKPICTSTTGMLATY